MPAYKNFNVIRMLRPGLTLSHVLSVLRDIRCDVYECERCLVSRRPFPGRKTFLLSSTARIAGREKRDCLCTNQHPRCASALQFFFSFCRATYTYLGFGIERRDTRLAAVANVTHILKLDQLAWSMASDIDSTLSWRYKCRDIFSFERKRESVCVHYIDM